MSIKLLIVALDDCLIDQPVAEEVKKDLTDKDVEMGFDISLTKHKGQVMIKICLFGFFIYSAVINFWSCLSFGYHVLP